MQAALDCFVALLLAMTNEQKRGRYSAAAVCARHHGGSEPEKRHAPSYEVRAMVPEQVRAMTVASCNDVPGS